MNDILQPKGIYLIRFTSGTMCYANGDDPTFLDWLIDNIHHIKSAEKTNHYSRLLFDEAPAPNPDPVSTDEHELSDAVYDAQDTKSELIKTLKNLGWTSPHEFELFSVRQLLKILSAHNGEVIKNLGLTVSTD